MHHIVYLDSLVNGLDLVLTGKKTMVIRGAMSPKIPYKKVAVDDELYFLDRKKDGLFHAKASVGGVCYFDFMSRDDTFYLIEKYQNELLLSTAQKRKVAGKMYITLVELCRVERVVDMKIDTSGISDSDDWLIVNDVSNVVEEKMI